MCEDGRREEIENRLLFAHFHETCFLSTDFLKIHKIKFHEYRSCGSRVVLCRRTDRHDEANSCFSQFCERAQKRTSKATAGYKSGKGQVRFVCIPRPNEITTCSTGL